MEWGNQKTAFTPADTDLFGFHEDHPCEIETIRISEQENGKLRSEDECLKSEQQFREWIEKCQPSSQNPSRPTLALAMHKLLGAGGDCMKPTDVPYGETTFRYACEQLFQHRAVTHALPRKSTVVFTSRSVDWGANSPGQSMVYNCKSDNESCAGNGNVVLSSTTFTNTPLTYGVLYGCTPAIIRDVKNWLKRCKNLSPHPLILPMVFVELERRRLINAMEGKSSELHQRVLDMENRLKKEQQRGSEKEDHEQTMAERDCDTIHMSLSMSRLKNGLEGLLTQISAMRQHLDKPSEITLGSSNAAAPSASDSRGVIIDLRLKEMTVELQSKLRTCDGLLEGITLATQMEWNYFTRTDSCINFTIAKASKRDSEQMRFISLLGMLFLPGTFLATLFSMTFFTWGGPSGNSHVSVWFTLYVGLTLITTVFTVCFWKWRSNREYCVADEQFLKEFEHAKSLIALASISSRSSFQGSTGSLEV